MPSDRRAHSVLDASVGRQPEVVIPAHGAPVTARKGHSSQHGHGGTGHGRVAHVLKSVRSWRGPLPAGPSSRPANALPPPGAAAASPASIHALCVAGVTRTCAGRRAVSRHGPMHRAPAPQRARSALGCGCDGACGMAREERAGALPLLHLAGVARRGAGAVRCWGGERGRGLAARRRTLTGEAPGPSTGRIGRSTRRRSRSRTRASERVSHAVQTAAAIAPQTVLQQRQKLRVRGELRSGGLMSTYNMSHERGCSVHRACLCTQGIKERGALGRRRGGGGRR